MPAAAAGGGGPSLREKENRAAFKHAAVYSFATVLSKAVGFLLLPLYAHVFRDIGYGIIGMMDAGLNFLSGLLGYLIRGGVVRIYHEEQTERDKRAVVSTGLILLWAVMSGLVLLILPFARPIATLWLGEPEYALYVLLSLIAFLLEITGSAAGVLLIIQQRSKVFSSIGLLRLVTGIGLNLWLIIGLKLGLTGYFLASLGMHAVSSALFHAIAIRQCGLRYDARIARKLIAFQLPLVPSNILSFFARQAERILLRFMVAIETVGVLEMAYKFPALISLFITQPFWQSWDTKRTEIAERPGAPEQIGRMFTYYVFLVLFAGLLLAVDIDPLIRLMTPPEFWAAIGIAEVIIVTEILNGCYHHFMFGIYYAKRTRTLGMIRAGASIFKLVTSFVLIYLYGLSGAAYSSAITAGLLVTLTWRASGRHYRMVLEKRRLAILVVGALALRTLIVELDLVELLGADRLERSLTPKLLAAMQGTFLASWRDGAAVRILQMKSPLVYDLGVRTLAACLFLLLVPVVHEGARRRLRLRLAIWRRAGTPSLAGRPAGPAAAVPPGPPPAGEQQP